jgi:type II secretory pathway pseudopilin PulG
MKITQRKYEENRLLGNRSRQSGYILLGLLLIIALLAIAAAIVVSPLTFEIKRDREAELIHRGVQYTRAIRAFTKATARYPLRLEELQSTDGRRYIRKLYKDPITGGDFQLLHFSDIRPGAPPPNVNGAGSSQQSLSAPADPNSAGQPDSAATSAQDPNSTNSENATNNLPGTQPSTKQQNFFQNASGNSLNANGNGNGFPPGGVIVGVASKSKERTIREFAGKNHYNDWLFFYDPGYDRGLRITGPTSMTPITPQINGASPVSGQQQPASSPANSSPSPQ